ncbi:MAG TPA: PEP/pyruvate-binding domain-containing protein, partial [Solirubrobacteraceae bacterium]|nr:PEP/pyruvate-binding domain-containing protein [Solirubrobacteraceae bacterium]
MPAPVVVSLAEPDAAVHALAGGKGAGLARLTAAGFAVPAGFTLTTEAHRRVLSAGLGERIAALAGALDHADPTELERGTAEIRRLIEAEPVPDAVVAGLAAAYAELGRS